MRDRREAVFSAYERTQMKRVAVSREDWLLRRRWTGSARLNTSEKGRPFDFGDTGLNPVTANWGFSRGIPIDRFYIEQFLARYADDVKDRVLEIGDDAYTQKFGGHRVKKSDVLDITPKSDSVSFVADLSDAPNVPSDTFNCIILTQVLIFIQDVSAALDTIYRILKPGGIALITVPGISQISSNPIEANAWSWSFYPKTLRWLLLEHGFDERDTLVNGVGNVKTTIGFLLGLAQSDLTPHDFDFQDERYPLVVTARAVKKRK